MTTTEPPASAKPRADLLGAARRSRIRLYAASFTVDAVYFGFGILLPVHARQTFDAAPTTLGALGTTSMLTYALTCVFTGRWSDRIGSRPLYLGGLGGLAFVSIPAAYIAPNLSLLFVASILFHISLGLFWPPLERELSLLSQRRTLARSVGTFNCTWAAGICIGGLGGTSSYERLGFGWGAAVFAALTAAALAILQAPMTRLDPATRSDGEEEGEEDAPSSGRVRLFLRIGWAANFSAYFATQGISYLFAHIRTELGFTIERMGMLLLAINLPRFATFLALRRLEGWRYSFRWLATLQAIAAVSLIGLSLLETVPAFLLLLPALGMFAGLSYTSSFYYGLGVEAREGTNSANHELFLSLGATLGPLACGLVAELSPDWPGSILAFCGGVILVALLVETAMAQRARDA